MMADIRGLCMIERKVVRTINMVAGVIGVAATYGAMLMGDYPWACINAFFAVGNLYFVVADYVSRR